MVVITSFRAPESAIRLRQPDVNVILDKKNLGIGTLFVSERTLSWQKDASDGFSMEYPNVSLHAVSKDPNVHNRECIYILTDPHINMDDTSAPEEDSDSDADSEPNLSELILVPENSSFVQTIYDAIKLCQELNPDPADIDDDDDDDNLYADAEDEMYVEAESEQADDIVVDNLAERLQNNSVNVQYNYSNGNNGTDEQFEDAD